jgi:hypothetical protein
MRFKCIEAQRCASVWMNLQARPGIPPCRSQEMTMKSHMLAMLGLATALALGGFTPAIHAETASSAHVTLADAGRMKAKKPKADLNLKARGGEAKDEHCGPGHVPCDDIFEKFCAKVLGGTMSGKQGWGGKTCFEPT